MNLPRFMQVTYATGEVCTLPVLTLVDDAVLGNRIVKDATWDAFFGEDAITQHGDAPSAAEIEVIKTLAVGDPFTYQMDWEDAPRAYTLSIVSDTGFVCATYKDGEGRERETYFGSIAEFERKSGHVICESLRKRTGRTA